MRLRFSACATALAIVLCAAPAAAQVQTGEVTGRVTDNTGAVLPGVTVTLSGPALIQPLTAITSETGTYQFPRIPIGSYVVRMLLEQRCPVRVLDCLLYGDDALRYLLYDPII